MIIIKYRKIFYGVSIVLVLASIIAIGSWGFNLGIDFKGGTSIDVEYSERPEVEEIENSIRSLSLGESIRPVGNDSYSIKTKALSENERQVLTFELEKGGATIKQLSTVGPILGAEAVKKSIISIILVLLCIVLFITFAFRGVSKPVSSWKYGLITIVALAHDVVIPSGFFALFGYLYGWEVDTLFVTALLVVLGFSVHDTIVVFDRVRENLKLSKEYKEKKEFETIVGESVSQTFVRSVNTSLSTLLALVVLYFVGGEVTKHFSLALIIGIAAGTYSSIFIASTLLVTVEKWQKRE